MENYEPRIQQIIKDIGALSEQNQSVELQFQAQFDEKNVQAEQIIEMKYKKIEEQVNQQLIDFG